MDRLTFRYQLTPEHLRPAARWMIWHRFGRQIWVRVLFALVPGVLAVREWADAGSTLDAAQ